MTAISSSAGIGAHVPIQEEFRGKLPHVDLRREGQSAGARSSEERQPEPATPLAQQAAALRAARAAELAATANSGGLGQSAEEITFGASERAELETHDNTRDAATLEEQRVAAAKRVEAIDELLRQLGGNDGAAMIRQRASRFAALWQRGETARAVEELAVDNFNPLERLALLNLAIKRQPDGPGARQLDDLLVAELESDGGAVVRRLMASPSAAPGAERMARSASDSPWLATMQSPPTHKLVLEAASSLGADGLDRLTTLAAARERQDVRMSRGAEVFLSLSLLRMIQQIRQVESVGADLLRARAAAAA